LHRWSRPGPHSLFAALLLAGYPFALAGHYDMFTPNTRRSRQFCTFQEAIAISIVFCSAAILLLWIHRMPLQAVALMVPLSAIVLTAWWQIWRTVNMRRAAREQAQVINQAAKELDAMIHASERLFVNKTTNLYKDYDDAVSAILSAGPSEVVKRKMLRAHKSKIYAEIGEWESDLRQIRGLLEEARRGTARLAVSEEDISAIARDAVSGADETVWRTRASAANIYEFMDRTGIPSRIKRVKE
jgi:hypothetical protein